MSKTAKSDCDSILKCRCYTCEHARISRAPSKASITVQISRGNESMELWGLICGEFDFWVTSAAAGLRSTGELSAISDE